MPHTRMSKLGRKACYRFEIHVCINYIYQYVYRVIVTEIVTYQLYVCIQL